MSQSTQPNPNSHSWSNSRSQIATIILVVVGLYLVGTIASRAINILDLKRQQAAMVNDYNRLQQTIEDLRAEVEYIQSDSYLEQTARSMLWGRPGEKLIVPLEDTAPPRLQPTPTRRP